MSTIRTFIFVDPMGSDFGGVTPQDEIAQHVECFEQLLRPAKLKWTTSWSFDPPLGTELVIYDFGGLMPGTDLMESNARRLVQWAADNPNALVSIVSSYTYTTYVRWEVDEFNRTSPEQLHNISSFADADYDVPDWFRSLYNLPKIEETPRHALRTPSLVLSALKFFEPNKRFLNYMQRYKDRLIYDVGAGCGQVARALSDAKFKVIAIDINEREQSECAVNIADGALYEYEPDSVVMLCRPCHGHFVEPVIRQAIKCGCHSVLYVGLDRNIDDDIRDLDLDFKRVASNVGKEHERIWLLQLTS